MAERISAETLGVLDDDERAQLHRLLRKLAGLPAEDDPARADAVTGRPRSPSGPDR